MTTTKITPSEPTGLSPTELMMLDQAIDEILKFIDEQEELNEEFLPIVDIEVINAMKIIVQSCTKLIRRSKNADV